MRPGTSTLAAKVSVTSLQAVVVATKDRELSGPSMRRTGTFVTQRVAARQILPGGMSNSNLDQNHRYSASQSRPTLTCT